MRMAQADAETMEVEFQLLVNALVRTFGKKIILQTLEQGVNLNSFKSERLHENHAVATCKLVTFSAFA
jgi:hypothetical protein